MQVNFIPGKKAILTVYQDGVETEKITLSDYNDTKKLHDLFLAKGFVKYTEVELMEVRQRAMKEKEENAEAGRMKTGFLRNVRTDLQKKRELKEKIKKLKNARENYMMDASHVV